jgi:hypothetical protein
VCFRTVAAVGLKGSLGHRDPLLFLKENLRVSNLFEYSVGARGNPAREQTSRCGNALASSGVLWRVLRQRSERRSLSSALQ